jgi:hypothetical protein
MVKREEKGSPFFQLGVISRDHFPETSGIFVTQPNGRQLRIRKRQSHLSMTRRPPEKTVTTVPMRLHSLKTEDPPTIAH